MYFNFWNKFVKRKTFVNFCTGRCGIRSCRYSKRLKQISKHEFAISCIGCQEAVKLVYLII